MEKQTVYFFKTNVLFNGRALFWVSGWHLQHTFSVNLSDVQCFGK